MWRINRVDASIWLITMATSALVNTELGLLVGVLVSAFCVLGRTQQVHVRELGWAPTADHYEDLTSYRGLQTHQGVAVFSYQAPIYYANQSLFKKSLYKCAGLDPVKERTLRMKFQKKKSKQQEEITGDTMMTSEKEAAGQQDGEAAATVTLMTAKKSPRRLRSLVIDCGAVSFLDTAGVNALKEVHKDYGELGVKVVLAQCSTSVLDALERGGYYPDTKGAEGTRTFFTITDAVRYVQSLSEQNGDYDSRC